MRYLILGSLLAAVLFLPASPVLAQESKPLSVQGLAIDPFLIEAAVSPGGKNDYSISLINTTDKPLVFSVSINDFVPNGRTGQPRFLDSEETGDPRFSLSSWIRITKQPDFVIAPRGQTTVKFSIAAPIDAEPGTYYGGILFGQAAQNDPVSGTAVEHKVGAIILVRLGNAQEKGTISEFFSQHGIYQKAPIDLLLSFHNYGNVHSKPKGGITIRNVFGAAVAQVPVNPDAAIVLPESERDFALAWQPWFAFGRYTAEAVLYYGNPKLEARAITSFWVIPVLPLLYILLGLAVLIVAGYFAVKKYNSYIIRKNSS
jgi:hypothetical protein